MYIKLYTQLNSLKFTDSVKLNTAKFMFRARHHSMPPNLQNVFKVKAYKPIIIIIIYDNLLIHRIRIRTRRKLFVYLVQGHSYGTI